MTSLVAKSRIEQYEYSSLAQSYCNNFESQVLFGCKPRIRDPKMWSNCPFALFPLVEVSTEQLNKILEDAFKGSQFSANPFWLPTSTDYSDAPQKLPETATDGTKPPISPSYKSPFIGLKAEDVATWLKNKPKEAEIDIHFFAVLDKTAQKGDVVICRQGGVELKDMDKLEFLRLDAEFAALELYTAQYGTWEDMTGSRGPADIEY